MQPNTSPLGPPLSKVLTPGFRLCFERAAPRLSRSPIFSFVLFFLLTRHLCARPNLRKLVRGGCQKAWSQSLGKSESQSGDFAPATAVNMLPSFTSTGSKVTPRHQAAGYSNGYPRSSTTLEFSPHRYASRPRYLPELALHVSSRSPSPRNILTDFWPWRLLA